MFAAQPFARDLRLTNSRNRISSLTISDRIVKSLGSIDFHFSSTRQRPSLRFVSFPTRPNVIQIGLLVANYRSRNGFTMRSNVYEMASRKKINYERITKLRVIGRWWLASFVYKFSPRWYLFFFFFAHAINRIPLSCFLYSMRAISRFIQLFLDWIELNLDESIFFNN